MFKKIVIGILIIVVVTIAFTQHQQNKKYERYISLEVRNSLLNVINATIFCNHIFSEIYQANEITYEQVQLLRHSFGIIGPSTHRLISIAQIYNENVPQGIFAANAEMDIYILQQFADILVKEGDSILLTEEQIYTIKCFNLIIAGFIDEIEKKIAGVYVPDAEEIKEFYFGEGRYIVDIDVWNKYYGDNMVRHKDWQKLLWALDEAYREKYDFW